MPGISAGSTLGLTQGERDAERAPVPGHLLDRLATHVDSRPATGVRAPDPFAELSELLGDELQHVMHSGGEDGRHTPAVMMSVAAVNSCSIMCAGRPPIAPLMLWSCTANLGYMILLMTIGFFLRDGIAEHRGVVEI